MNRRSILTKTGKGLMEATGKTSDLSRDLRNILKEIDGKVSVSELMRTFSKMTEPELIEALKSMEREGYLREFVGKQDEAPRPSRLRARAKKPRRGRGPRRRRGQKPRPNIKQGFRRGPGFRRVPTPRPTPRRERKRKHSTRRGARPRSASAGRSRKGPGARTRRGPGARPRRAHVSKRKRKCAVTPRSV